MRRKEGKERWMRLGGGKEECTPPPKEDRVRAKERGGKTREMGRGVEEMSGREGSEWERLRDEREK